MSRSRDSFATKTQIEVEGTKLAYFSLPKLAQKTGKDVGRLPFSLRILLENLLRFEDGKVVAEKDVEALLAWDPKAEPDTEIGVPPGARRAAGLHRRARGGGSRGDARRHRRARR